MALKIRLKRMGMKKSPFYRFVVSEASSPRDGRFVEELGYYNPTKNPIEVKIEEEKVLKWLGNGATPTDTVRSLLSKAGIMKKFDESKR
jgi:small subunit ribosomal protein S16